MNIEVITTPNTDQKETGFGTRASCEQFVRSARRDGASVRLSVCESQAELDDVVARKPELVVLAVKCLRPAGSDVIWLSSFFRDNAIAFTGS